MLLDEPLTYYWLEKGSQVGWVGADPMGLIQAAAEPFRDLVGMRVAHLPVEYSVVRLRAQIELTHESVISTGSNE